MHKLPLFISSAVSFEILFVPFYHKLHFTLTTQGVEVYLGFPTCPNDQKRLVQHFLNGELPFPCKLRCYWYYVIQHFSFWYCSLVISIPGLVSAHCTHIITPFTSIWSFGQKLLLFVFLIKDTNIAASPVTQHQQIFAFYSPVTVSVHRIHSTSK